MNWLLRPPHAVVDHEEEEDNDMSMSMEEFMSQQEESYSSSTTTTKDHHNQHPSTGNQSDHGIATEQFITTPRLPPPPHTSVLLNTSSTSSQFDERMATGGSGIGRRILMHHCHNEPTINTQLALRELSIMFASPAAVGTSIVPHDGSVVPQQQQPQSHWCENEYPVVIEYPELEVEDHGIASNDQSLAVPEQPHPSKEEVPPSQHLCGDPPLSNHHLGFAIFTDTDLDDEKPKLPVGAKCHARPAAVACRQPPRIGNDDNQFTIFQDNFEPSTSVDCPQKTMGLSSETHACAKPMEATSFTIFCDEDDSCSDHNCAVATTNVGNCDQQESPVTARDKECDDDDDCGVASVGDTATFSVSDDVVFQTLHQQYQHVSAVASAATTKSETNTTTPLHQSVVLEQPIHHPAQQYDHCESDGDTATLSLLSDELNRVMAMRSIDVNDNHHLHMDGTPLKQGQQFIPKLPNNSHDGDTNWIGDGDEKMMCIHPMLQRQRLQQRRLDSSFSK
jgi:hypothetical protein